jgi:tetratricopeptide (TPR) repeat protein
MKLIDVRISVMLLALVGASVARADEVSDEARRRFEVGEKAYDLQRWSDALEQFQAAYELRQDPALLFNIAQCQRQLGKRVAAAHSYRAYLEHVPDAPNRQQVLDKIAELEAGAAPAREATPAPTSPPAPVALSPPPNAPPPAQRARAPRWRPNPAGPVLIALGTAAAAVGIGLAVHGDQLDKDVLNAMTLATAEQFARDRDGFENSGWAIIAVGGSAAVAGIIVLTVESIRAHRRAELAR